MRNALNEFRSVSREKLIYNFCSYDQTQAPNHEEFFKYNFFHFFDVPSTNFFLGSKATTQTANAVCEN